MIPLHIEIAKSILATPRNFASDEFTLLAKNRGYNPSASAISDGRTCHSRIEQAYAQPRLFEDEKTIPKQDILI